MGDNMKKYLFLEVLFVKNIKEIELFIKKYTDVDYKKIMPNSFKLKSNFIISIAYNKIKKHGAITLKWDSINSGEIKKYNNIVIYNIKGCD